VLFHGGVASGDFLDLEMENGSVDDRKKLIQNCEICQVYSRHDQMKTQKVIES
jgi:hypothetical protein